MPRVESCLSCLRFLFCLFRYLFFLRIASPHPWRAWGPKMGICFVRVCISPVFVGLPSPVCPGPPHDPPWNMFRPHDPMPRPLPPEPSPTPSRRSPGPSGPSWEPSGPLGSLLGASWAVVGASWAVLGAFWAVWGHLGAVLDPIVAYPGSSFKQNTYVGAFITSQEPPDGGWRQGRLRH